MLLLRIAVIQRECLNALFCSPPSAADPSCPCGEREDFAFEDSLRAVRLSVGLLDVPPVSFASIESVDSPLREGLPCRELLQAEAAVASAVSDGSFPGSAVDGRKVERALKEVARYAHTASSRRRFLCSTSQRLAYVLRQLVKLMTPRSLYRQIYRGGSPFGQVATLKPAGELLLAFMELCLRLQMASSNACRQQGRNTLDGERQSAPVPEVSKNELMSPPSRIGELQGKSPEAGKQLEHFALRLRAEIDAIEALEGMETVIAVHVSSGVLAVEFLPKYLFRCRHHWPADSVNWGSTQESAACTYVVIRCSAGIAGLPPVAALLALEELMQQPQLQHLEHLAHPPADVLSAGFYDCLLRCFAGAAALPTDCWPADPTLELHSVCTALLRRSGLWSMCYQEILPGHAIGGKKGCCMGSGYRPRIEGNDRNSWDPQAARGQLCEEEPLLPPPETCEATAKAFCCFLHPDVRPYSPWLCRQPAESDVPATAAKATADAPASSKHECGLTTSTFGKDTREYAQPMTYPATTGRALQKDRGKLFEEWALPAELRALDRELRPVAKEEKQKRQLHRLLVKWLKADSWTEQLGLQRPLHGSGGCGCLGGERTCRKPPSERLFPLLIPYGSSVTGFGDWGSDLDLCLLLPSVCSSCWGSEAAKGSGMDNSKANYSDTPRPSNVINTESHYGAKAPSVSSAGCNHAASISNHGSCPDKECPQEMGASKVCLRHSPSRGEAIEVLTRLKKLICEEPQLKDVLTQMEVVVPPRAPPVLRGVHLQRKIPKTKPQRGVRCAEVNSAANLCAHLRHFPPQSGACHPNCPEAEGDFCATSIGSSHWIRQPLDNRSQARGGVASTSLAVAWDTKREEIISNRCIRGAGEPRPHTDGGPGKTPASPGLHSTATEERPSKGCGSLAQRLLPLSSAQQAFLQSGEAARHIPAEKTSSVEFEITVGSALGPLNSQMLREYGRCCPLLLPLVRIIRHWADCRGLTGKLSRRPEGGRQPSFGTLL